MKRHAERAEYRFYYRIILPICLVSTIMSRLGSIFHNGEDNFMPRHRSILSEASSQANDIIPFIFSR